MNARPVVVMIAIALSGMVGASEKRWMCPQMEMELSRIHAMRDDVLGRVRRIREGRRPISLLRETLGQKPVPCLERMAGVCIRFRGNGGADDIGRMEDMDLQSDSRRGEIPGVGADAKRLDGNRTEALIT